MTVKAMTNLARIWAVLGLGIALSGSWIDGDAVLVAACVVCSTIWGAAAQIRGRL